MGIEAYGMEQTCSSWLKFSLAIARKLDAAEQKNTTLSRWDLFKSLAFTLGDAAENERVLMKNDAETWVLSLTAVHTHHTRP